MSEENLFWTVVIPHVSEEKVSEKLCDTMYIEMEITSVSTQYDRTITCSSKDATQKVHLQSYGWDESISLYEEEFESYTSDVANASVQYFDGIDSFS